MQLKLNSQGSKDFKAVPVRFRRIDLESLQASATFDVFCPMADLGRQFCCLIRELQKTDRQLCAVQLESPSVMIVDAVATTEIQ
jgi:hypothetical protein